MTDRDTHEYGKWREKFHNRRDEEDFDYHGSPNPKRFYRSRREKVIAGVCGGMAERFGWDPVLLRVLAVLLFFMLAGPLIVIAYIVIWMVTPFRPFGASNLSEEEDRFWRGVSDRPTVTFSNLRYKFMDLEDRLRSMETAVTSDEWRLRRQFKDLEQNR